MRMPTSRCPLYHKTPPRPVQCPVQRGIYSYVNKANKRYLINIDLIKSQYTPDLNYSPGPGERKDFISFLQFQDHDQV